MTWFELGVIIGEKSCPRPRPTKGPGEAGRTGEGGRRGGIAVWPPSAVEGGGWKVRWRMVRWHQVSMVGSVGGGHGVDKPLCTVQASERQGCVPMKMTQG